MINRHQDDEDLKQLARGGKPTFGIHKKRQSGHGTKRKQRKKRLLTKARVVQFFPFWP